MTLKRFKYKAFFEKITAKNRLIILNDDTFEEMFSLRLNILNVFIVATVGAIFLISITTYIIAFTPLREYIPGYSSAELKQNAIVLGLKSDSLDFELKKKRGLFAVSKKSANWRFRICSSK